MKRTLKESNITLSYRGLQVTYKSVDGESPALEIPVLIPIPEGEEGGVETRNQAKAEAIRKVKALLGDGVEVEILLS